MEKVLETDIIPEKGYLYFCKKREDGKLSVYKVKMSRGRKKKE